MKQSLIAIIAGLLFGAGLAGSDMNNPERVQGFLDLFADWDPTLIFVMIAALAIATPAYQWLLHKRKRPIFAAKFYLPASHAIDKNLLIGSGLFGIGWALVGYCPGPAIASLAYGHVDVYIFVIAMMIGAKLHQLLNTKLPR